MSKPFRSSNVFLKGRPPKMKKPELVNLTDEDNFPTLGSSSNSIKEPTKTNFSKALQTHKPTIYEKNETEIPFGWVQAKTDKNKIHVNMSKKTEMHLQQSKEQEYNKKVKHMLNSMVTRWQNERDALNDLLGEESPYWDTICLFKMEDLDNDDLVYDSETDEENELDEQLIDEYFEEECF